MRNVGSPGPWLWRPSLQKNVAGLELRLGAHPPPGGGGESRTGQVSEDLAGWGLRWVLASLQRCSHGEFPKRAQPILPPPSDLVPGVDFPCLGLTTCFCCCLVKGEAQKFTLYFRN